MIAEFPFSQLSIACTFPIFWIIFVNNSIGTAALGAPVFCNIVDMSARVYHLLAVLTSLDLKSEKSSLYIYPKIFSFFQFYAIG
jgi:hypothetical protein